MGIHRVEGYENNQFRVCGLRVSALGATMEKQMEMKCFFLI